MIECLFMKKKIIICLFTFFAIAILVGGYFWYMDAQNKKNNLEFSYDVVKVLDEIYESRGINDEEEKESDSVQDFVDAYSMKEHVLNAKDIMQKWQFSENNFNKKISTSLLKAIDDLSQAAEIYIDLLQNSYNRNEKMALFKVKLDQGREALILAATGLVFEDEGINLTQEQKKYLIDYINGAFNKEFREYESNHRSNLQTEIWAALIIRTSLELGLQGEHAKKTVFDTIIKN